MKNKKRSAREVLGSICNQIFGELFAGLILVVAVVGLFLVGFFVLPSFVIQNVNPKALVLMGTAVLLLLLAIIGGVAKIFKKKPSAPSEVQNSQDD